MKIYTNGQFDKEGGCVLALGSFDALHIAHISLIEGMLSYAKKYNVRGGVYMFDGRIENVIYQNGNYKNVYTTAQRIRIVEDVGVDFAYLESFDKDFMNMSALDFAKMLKEKFGVICVVVGFDYTFGKGGIGDAKLLLEYGKQLGFDVVVIPEYSYKGETVSSTKVRQCIENGAIDEAGELLGRAYEIEGKVIHGRKVGRQMGVPTANIEILENVLLPKNGVYCGYITINGGHVLCVVNIGICPTFNLDKISVEVHVIDFDGDLYDDVLCVGLLDRIRDEKIFASQEDLKEQILDDICTAKSRFLKNLH